MPQIQKARRWRVTNENASSFASKIPTIAKPTNDGVIDMLSININLEKYIMLWPILLGAENDATSMRIIGWERCLLDGSLDLWYPSIIGEYACVACTAVGVAGAAVLNTERFCDAITPVAARQRDKVIAAGTYVNSDYEAISPVGDLIAHVKIPLAGFELYELTSDQTTGTATFNCLYKFLDDEG